MMAALLSMSIRKTGEKQTNKSNKNHTKRKAVNYIGTIDLCHLLKLNNIMNFYVFGYVTIWF